LPPTGHAEPVAGSDALPPSYTVLASYVPGLAAKLEKKAEELLSRR
jgi:hypothetical protein